MAELLNTNRLRVSWTNLREHWDAPPFLFSHYKSGDHGKRRLETNISLHIFGRGFHVKWRPDGKRERPCTCHPDDSPPRPCPGKYALQDCRKAAARNAENISASPLDSN